MFFSISTFHGPNIVYVSNSVFPSCLKVTLEPGDTMSELMECGSIMTTFCNSAFMRSAFPISLAWLSLTALYYVKYAFCICVTQDIYGVAGTFVLQKIYDLIEDGL